MFGKVIPVGQFFELMGTFIKFGPMSEQTARLNRLPKLVTNLPTNSLLERYAYDNSPFTPLCGGLACIVIYMKEERKKYY